MLPQDILPAVPRQKVKHKFGGFAHVLNLGMDKKKIAVMTINPARLEEWNVEDCTPVFEEPRPFRVGDKVVYEYEDGRLEYTIIQAIRKLGDDYKIFTPGDTYAVVGETMRYRHATQEEIAKYFN